MPLKIKIPEKPKAFPSIENEIEDSKISRFWIFIFLFSTAIVPFSLPRLLGILGGNDNAPFLPLSGLVNSRS